MQSFCYTSNSDTLTTGSVKPHLWPKSIEINDLLCSRLKIQSRLPFHCQTWKPYSWSAAQLLVERLHYAQSAECTLQDRIPRCDNYVTSSNMISLSCHIFILPDWPSKLFFFVWSKILQNVSATWLLIEHRVWLCLFLSQTLGRKTWKLLKQHDGLLLEIGEVSKPTSN